MTYFVLGVLTGMTWLCMACIVALSFFGPTIRAAICGVAP